MIFTPRLTIDHAMVQSVAVFGAVPADPMMMNPLPIRARLMVQTTTERHILYGTEAFSVLRQLETAGFYTSEQRQQVQAALQDEMEMEKVLT